MKNSIYNISKKVLFKMDPEFVHNFAIKVASSAPFIGDFLTDSDAFSSIKYGVNVGRSRWSFPVGLAAGMDKDCLAVPFFSTIGFGAIEVGTVTPLAQSGNNRPRLFRYINERSIRNRMGFNNCGSDELLRNLLLAKKNVDVPIGVNFGKNKITAQESAKDDYLILFDKIGDSADYVVLNFSSPNTPGLRDLQQIDKMREIFQEIRNCYKNSFKKDIFIKISPDLALEDISEIIDLVKEFSFAGIIATNTTIMPEMGAGGISGPMLKNRAEKIRFHILDELKECPNVELIGVGGISDFSDIWRFWKRGGKSVQILTSLIFEGPALLNSIRKDIDRVLAYNELNSVSELLKHIDKAKFHEG